MKYIELVGPSGVGKTYLKMSLLKWRRRSGFKLFDQGAVSLNAVNSPLFRNLLEIMVHSELKAVRTVGLVGAAANSARFLNRELSIDWDAQWREFLSWAIHNYTSDGVDVGVAANRIRLLIETVAQAYFIRHSSQKNRLTVFDEGICQRGISLAQALKEEYCGQVEKFYTRCLAPDGVILVTADIRTVEKRLRSRSKNFNGHLSTTEYAFAATAICRKIMRERGVPILDIDVTDEIGSDISFIVDFLETVWRR